MEAGHVGLWDSGEDDLLPDQAVLCDALVQDREDSPLQALRVPVLIDKWHAPCYHTLTWDNDQFSIVSDLYFTDSEPLDPCRAAGVLTLELSRGVELQQPGQPRAVLQPDPGAGRGHPAPDHHAGIPPAGPADL